MKAAVGRIQARKLGLGLIETLDNLHPVAKPNEKKFAALAAAL